MLSNTTTAIDDAFQDVSTFLNVSEQVESVLEAEDGAKAQARPQEAPAAAEKADRRGAAAQDLGQRMMDPKKVMFRDKVTFFLGVVNVA